jgi:hypothetical protein
MVCRISTVTLLLLPVRQQRDRVPLQVLPIDHEEERQQYHRQDRGHHPRGRGQHAIGVVDLGPDHLHRPRRVLAAGGAGDVLGGLVRVLHRLGQLLQLRRQAAQLARGLADPFAGRLHQLLPQQDRQCQAAAQHCQRGQETRDADALQHADDRVADQGEEHRQQHRQDQVLGGP